MSTLSINAESNAARFVAALRQQAPWISYRELPEPCRQLIAESRQYGPDGIAELLQCVLKQLCDQAEPRLAALSLTPRIKEFYREWVHDARRLCVSEDAQYFHPENDALLKDMAVCNFKAIPVGGAWLVEPKLLWRRPLLRRAGMRVSAHLWFLARHFMQSKCVLEIHTVERYIARFTEQHREQCYLNLADLMRRDSNIKAMTAASWFYDPAVSEISPRLAFLTAVPLAHGARVFRVGSSEQDVKLALKRSNTRRKHYEAGTYVPTRYYLVWPRRPLMAWAEAFLSANDPKPQGDLISKESVK